MFDEFVRHDVYLNKAATLVGLGVMTPTHQLSPGLEDGVQVTDLSSNPGSLIEGTYLIGGRRITHMNFLHTVLTIFLFQLSILVLLNYLMTRSFSVMKRLCGFSNGIDFINCKVKLDFHLWGIFSGGGPGGLHSLPLEDDVVDGLLIFVPGEHVEEGLGQGDHRGRLALAFDDTGQVIFIHQGSQGILLSDEGYTLHLELKTGIKNSGRFGKKYLPVYGGLVFIPEDFGVPTDCLDVGRWIREAVEQRQVVIGVKSRGTSQKDDVNKTIVPGEDRCPGVAAHPLASDNLIRRDSELEHLQGQVPDDLEGRLSALLVTRRKTFARYDETTFYVLSIYFFDLFLNKCFEGLLIPCELSLAGLQISLACFEGTETSLCGHGDNNPVSWFFGDRDNRKVSLESNVLGVASGMGSADKICFDFNLVFVINFHTVYVCCSEEETSNWVGIKEDISIHYTSRY